MENKKKQIFVNRANQAILFALFLLKLKGIKKVYIPDQGGWIAFKRFPKYLDFELEEIKTDLGKPLKEELEEVQNSALFLCSSPGYLVNLTKEIKEIKKILNENNSFLILDNSSCLSFGGDIDLMSFGFYKPINLGFGGLFKVNNKELLEIWKENFSFFNSLVKSPLGFEEIMENRFKELEKRVKIALEFSKKTKDIFEHYLIKEIKEENALNIALKFDTELFKKFKKWSIPILKLPNYNRLKIKAISLENKKMLFNEKTKDFSLEQLKEFSKELVEKLEKINYSNK